MHINNDWTFFRRCHELRCRTLYARQTIDLKKIQETWHICFAFATTCIAHYIHVPHSSSFFFAAVFYKLVFLSFSSFFLSFFRSFFLSVFLSPLSHNFRNHWFLSRLRSYVACLSTVRFCHVLHSLSFLRFQAKSVRLVRAGERDREIQTLFKDEFYIIQSIVVKMNI
jgi:hypothetical protein